MDDEALREALRALNRRELQARAKALGVRANGKSVDIIESCLKAQRQGTLCASAVAKENNFLAAEDDENEADVERRGFNDRDAKMPTPGGSELPLSTPPATGAEAEANQSVTTIGLAQPAAEASTPTLEVLASRASAAALAASLARLRLQSQLKVTVAKARLSARRQQARDDGEDDASGCSPGTSPDQSASEPGRDLGSSSVKAGRSFETSPEPSFHSMPPPGGNDISRRLVFGRNAPCSPTRGADSDLGDLGELQQEDELHSHSDTPQKLQEAPRAASGEAGATARGDVPAPCAGAAGTDNAALASTPPRAASPVPAAGVEPSSVQPKSGVKASAVHVTARTPARQQRLMGLAMVPPLGHPAPTHFDRPVGAGGVGGTAPRLLPRTPGTALRTPARRVAVVTDEAAAQAMDTWVTQNLLVSALGTQAGGVAWRDLLGLEQVKERLQAICYATNSGAAAVGSSTPQPSTASPLAASTPTHATCTSGTVAPIASMAASRGGCAMDKAVRGTGPPAAGRDVGPSGTGITAGGGTRGSCGLRSAALAAAPRAAAASPTGRSSPARMEAPVRLTNAAVLLCGPPGIGKGSIARALAAELGASYISVPPDLPSRCPDPPSAAVRAVFRVAKQVPGPAVVHFDGVDALAGVEANSRNPECRRIRTELLVGLDELLHLQAPGAPQVTAAPAARSGVAASPTASSACTASHVDDGGSSSGRARVKVLVLSTASCPAALDDALAASLGRTERLLVSPPDKDEREMFLLGRLLGERAALGVEHVNRLVQCTEGLTFSDLDAVCDRAAKVANMNGTDISEEDLVAALCQSSCPVV